MQNESSEKSKQILEEYYKFSRQEIDEIKEGIHQIEDRWNGQIGIVWKNNLLYGYYNLDNKDLQNKYLKLFAGN